MRRRLVPLLVLPLALAATPVLAQSSPSTEQIIQSLKPNGNLLQGDTRGIRLVNPGDGAAKPQTAAPQTAAPSVSLTVEFASGSAELSPQVRQALDALGRALSSQDLAQYRFRIEGHTDTVGTSAANKMLSQRRAEAVSAYLAQKFGIAPARLEAIGMGEDGLAVVTPPQTPNARNRRVKVVNLGA